jgi:hypothetical protein
LDDEGALLLSLYTTSGGVIEAARIGWVREPLTPLAVAAVAHSLVRCWLAPEIAPDAAQALWSTFDTLTTPF